MSKYRVTLRRQVWQEATLYVDAASAMEAETMVGHAAIWHDISAVKNTFEAHAQRSEDVDTRYADEVHEKYKADAQEALDEEFGS